MLLMRFKPNFDTRQYRHSPVVNKRIATITFGGLVREVDVSSTHARSASPHETWFSDGYRQQIFVQDIHVRVRHRLADADRAAGGVWRDGVHDRHLPRELRTPFRVSARLTSVGPQLLKKCAVLHHLSARADMNAQLEPQGGSTKTLNALCGHASPAVATNRTFG